MIIVGDASPIPQNFPDPLTIYHYILGTPLHIQEN